MADPEPRRPRPPADPATIGVFSLSGNVDPARLDEGIARLEAAGHRVITAEQARHQWRYFAGTDEQRVEGFHRLLDDPAIDVMLAARGGYGITRILPAIDWARVGASGKVFAGFSDFTAFNCAALARAGLATLHGPMVAIDFGDGDPDEFMLRHFRSTLWGREDSETVACDTGCPPRAIRGRLWGGNLSMLAHLVGTPYLPAIEGGLLYVEEIAEEPYAIERLFLQLHHAGILARQAAILLGDFPDCVPANPARYPYAMEEVIETLRAIAPCPVLAGLPFGHVARKLTLPFGMPALLSLDTDRYTLAWPGLAGP
ncbi:MAG TPA: LD-carboxypeptidase [Usitatibacteraceae bacterium]|nr:LD-carboxypeptidase [Usitatibacteraceae bacterium]